MRAQRKNIRIMRFNELKSEGDIISRLYDLENKEIIGLVNDLIHGGVDKSEVVEDILLVLDDIKGITPDQYHEIEEELYKYIK